MAGCSCLKFFIYTSALNMFRTGWAVFPNRPPCPPGLFLRSTAPRIAILYNRWTSPCCTLPHAPPAILRVARRQSNSPCLTQPAPSAFFHMRCCPMNNALSVCSSLPHGPDMTGLYGKPVLPVSAAYGRRCQCVCFMLEGRARVRCMRTDSHAPCCATGCAQLQPQHAPAALQGNTSYAAWF